MSESKSTPQEFNFEDWESVTFDDEGRPRVIMERLHFSGCGARDDGQTSYPECDED